VLADLALESEAATRLMLHLAAAIDAPDDNLQRAWKRIMTPAAKFWICKRALEFTGECMEVWGGNGYVETGPMARLYREAPVNSIWEGSGNVMCLDVLRAMDRDPEGLQLLLQFWNSSTSEQVRQMVQELKKDLALTEFREKNARRITQKLVLTAQAFLMSEYAEKDVAIAFTHSRMDAECGRLYGSLGSEISNTLLDHIISRAFTE